ncbi:hypothetical protein FBY30_3657 [Arthrobacter sp. SLBN-83]|uniref:hypothetical protein n=1 Tax=Arthrobacter sp. SLBN-83 TaxID=2768449 RepID=UPI0011730B8E|nr:hypothetical protein [Arthrobacter sp. SLBN-83]TQJ61365.1 hypothetical protein FBY30_3657 [Arthrobacter sp. SLBN-83]
MKAPEKTSDQPRAESARGPVFVDASGRRLRRIQLIGLGVVGLVAAYVILVLAAFIGGSGVSAPFLPLPAAAGPRETPSSPPPVDPRAGLTGPAIPVVEQSPAAVPLPASAVTAVPPVAGPAVVPAAPAAPAPAPAAAPVPAPAPAAAGTAAASGATAPGSSGTAPGSSGTAPGSSGTAPGASGSAPGQTTRPTAPAHQ